MKKTIKHLNKIINLGAKNGLVGRNGLKAYGAISFLRSSIMSLMIITLYGAI